MKRLIVLHAQGVFATKDYRRHLAEASGLGNLYYN